MKRYYFKILHANVLECVWAESFIEAKQKASREWLPCWNQIEWLETSAEPPQTTLPVTIDE